MSVQFRAEGTGLSPAYPVLLELQALQRKDAQTLTEALRRQMDYAVSAVTALREPAQENLQSKSGPDTVMPAGPRDFSSRFAALC